MVSMSSLRAWIVWEQAEEQRASRSSEVFSTDWSFGGGQDECRFGDGADSLRAQSDAVERLPAGLEQGDPQGVGKVRNVGLDLPRWQSAARGQTESLLSSSLPAR